MIISRHSASAFFRSLAATVGVLCAASLLPTRTAFSQPVEGTLLHSEPGGIARVLREQRRGDTFLVYPKAGGAKRVRVRDGKILHVYAGACSGSAFAGQYVVGLTANCLLDDDRERIVDLGPTPAFDNAFHISWLDEDDTSVRFLMNGRPWTSEGYIMLRTIDKVSSRAQAKNFVSGVPGYSGAMSVNRGIDTFLFTMGTGEFSNVLYSAGLAGLRAAAAAGATFNFQEKFQEAARFEGLSFNMDALGDKLVYHTEESYLYDIKGNRRQEHGLRQGCEPFAFDGPDALLAQCDGKEIRRFPIR